MSRYKAYPAYKESGVEWLGRVPEGWVSHKIKFIARFSGGGTPTRDNLDYWGGDIPWVSPKDMKCEDIQSAEDNITKTGLLNSSTSLIDPGQVLIVVRSGILKHTIPVAINSVEVALNQDMKALRFDPKLCLNLFFLRWVQGFNNDLLQAWLKQGATVESIEHDFIADTMILLPSVEDQTLIAAHLDRETTRIDGLVEKKTRFIELLREKRQALITHAVTKGLDPNAKMKDSGVEWLGEVPEHWSTCKLSFRYSVELGKMLDEKRVVGNNLIPYLRNQDVQWGLIRCEDLPEMDIFPDELGRYTVEYGDLLVCEGGDVGRAAIWKGENNVIGFQKALHRLRARSSKKDFAGFMYYVLLTAKKCGVFEESDAKATIAHLPAEKFRQYRFPFPTIEEQQVITAHLDRETTRIDSLIAKTERSIELLKERRSALITAAVTGQIDLREAA